MKLRLRAGRRLLAPHQSRRSSAASHGGHPWSAVSAPRSLSPESTLPLQTPAPSLAESFVADALDIRVVQRRSIRDVPVSSTRGLSVEHAAQLRATPREWDQHLDMPHRDVLEALAGTGRPSCIDTIVRLSNAHRHAFFKSSLQLVLVNLGRVSSRAAVKQCGREGYQGTGRLRSPEQS